MTTASWSTVLDHTSDAGFRAWGSELAAKFAAVGMVQTADTGQINWTTVTRPGTNTSAGYEIWRLSGSALYFKIEYGTGSAAANPSHWFTAGTGSNGSGTLTGQLSTRTQCGCPTASVGATVTNYQSYLCATTSYFGLAWKIGSSSTAGRARMFLTAMQTVDSSGAVTTTGYEVCFSTNNTTLNTQCVATTAGVTGTLFTFTTHFLFPCNTANPPTSSTDGALNNQAMLWWYGIFGTTPMQPLLHVAAIFAFDLGIGNTAAMTLLGSTPHTYLCCTNSPVGDALNSVQAGNINFVMIWE